MTDNDESDDVLREFRSQWRAELIASRSGATNRASVAASAAESPASRANRRSVQDSSDAEIAEATKLFEHGSELEEVGKVFEAMHLYRRAMQIVPNIDMHIYENERLRDQIRTPGATSSTAPSVALAVDSGDPNATSEDLTNVDLMARFLQAIQDSGTFIERAASGASAVIQTGGPSSSCHIGALPAELLLYILRWVVSDQLDTRSLDACALVSRGFYVCARDPDIWRLACQRVWGADEAHRSLGAFSTWRHMFRAKARIQLHGVYSSKTSYFRLGENSFQDQFYRPMHLIEYYRYVRFFADRHVYMLTTPDPPAVILPRLVGQPRQQQRADLLHGTYTIDGSTVELRMRRNRNSAKPADQATAGRRRRPSLMQQSTGAYDADRHQTYCVRLRIRNGRQPQTDEQTSALVWTSYRTYRDGPTKTDGDRVLLNEFDLKPSMYPALVFGPVVDFHSLAAVPLS